MSELLIKLFVKNYNDVKEPTVRQSYGQLGGFTGIVCNLLLCVMKIVIGSLTASISVVADGLNNLSDMGSSVITMIGFKLAGKPADSDHPFGHGRMEYMSAFVVAVLILLVGFELIKSSISSLINGDDSPKYTIWALIILIISIAVKLWMYLFNRKIGKKINSEALMATAQDSLNDSIATAVILLSVGASMLFEIPFNLDAVMGVLVALFILYSGITTAKNTLDEILGGPPDAELVEEIKNTVLSFSDFIGIHDLIVHNYGPGRQFASVHVEVPQNIDIVKCHEQIDLCEKLVNEKLDISLVIHMDPIDADDKSIAETRQQLSDGIRIIDEKLSLHDFRMTPAGEMRTNLIFDVVVPATLKISVAELEEKISSIAKLINPTYTCVITFDNDYSGRK